MTGSDNTRYSSGEPKPDWLIDFEAESRKSGDKAREQLRSLRRRHRLMGILIEGTKIFEDDQTVTYAFTWPGAGRSGEVSMAKSEAQKQLSMLASPLDPAAARILVKAHQEAVASGAWPDKVLYAA
jgi:hypothetical protein